MRIKLSVVIPIYNAEMFLPQCIDSVLSQSLQAIEVICIDDCSTDSSPQVVAAYMEKDTRIRLIRNSSNLHAGLCRNIGLQYATGEYVLFMDADDWLAENALDDLYSQASKKGADVIRCRSVNYDNESGTIGKSLHNYLKRIPFFLHGIKLNYKRVYPLFSKINVAPWGGLFKRSFLIKNQISFNDLLCVNDRSFFWESIIKAEVIIFSKTVLMFYRINIPGSLVGNRIRHFDCHFKSYELVYELSKGLPLRMRRNILNGEMLDMVNWLNEAQENPYFAIIKPEFKSFLTSTHIPHGSWQFKHRKISRKKQGALSE